MFALLIPALLSFLVLAAHFFRNDQPILVFLCLCAPCLLLVRKTWATVLLQVLLLIGALEWVRTLLEIAAVRQETGQPWHRMAAILGGVGAFTALSGMVFFLPALRRHYAASCAAVVEEKPSG